MRSILVLLAIGATFAGFGQDAQPASPDAATGKVHYVKKVDKAKLDAAVYRKTGGKLKEPRTQKGRFVYVNCQSAVPNEVLVDHAQKIASSIKVAIDVESGEFSLPNPAVKGEACLFVVDDPALPMSLVAPEARWAMVNMAPLKTEKKAFFDARVKKELSRGFSYLGGAANSQFDLALTGCVVRPSGLDEFASDEIPFDVLRRIEGYMRGYGIAPYKLTTYRKACQEGWAPAPTNDVQQAIWDEVHELPSKPIKIEFDPQRDAGK